MKIKNIFLTTLIVSLLLSLLVSCEKDKNDEETQLPYLFRPVGLDVQMVKTKATISWYAVDNAQSYTVQISSDSLTFENIVVDDTVVSSPFSVELQGNTLYSVRIKANGVSSEQDSKFNIYGTVRTPEENLFNDYTSMMNEQGSALVKWQPGNSVTSLVFKATGLSDKNFSISADELTAGTKTCTGLANGAYTVEIYNNQFKRGVTQVTIEGDYFISNGDNLATVISSAASGSVVIVRPGTYNMGASALNIDKSIKIKGLYINNLPVLYMDAAASTTAGMFNISTTATLDYLRFENIDFSGYIGNVAGSRIGYLFNQSTGCTVTEIRFTNCNMHNLGNTPFRVQGTAVKSIESLIFEGCKMNDIGYGSVYAIVNNNVASTINNIRFKNCTIYNFAGSIVLHTSMPSNSVVLENCSFNEITTSGTGTSIRYIIDYNTKTVTSGVTIKNCIFGSTPRPYTDGVRVAAGTTLTVSGSYCTTDYKDNNSTTTFTISGLLSLFNGTSTDLWTDPVGGDFHFKATSFAGKNTAGDSRWW